MEKECCNCGKIHNQDDYFTFKVEDTFEGKNYEWFYCSIECAFTYKGDEILDKIKEQRSKKLKTFLEGQKMRLDHPKFKL